MQHPLQCFAAEHEGVFAAGIELQAGNVGAMRIEAGVLLPLRLAFGRRAVNIELDAWPWAALSGRCGGLNVEAEMAPIFPQIGRQLPYRLADPVACRDKL